MMARSGGIFESSAGVTKSSRQIDGICILKGLRSRLTNSLT